MSDPGAREGVSQDGLLWHVVILELGIAGMGLAADELFAVPLYRLLRPYLGLVVVACLVGGGLALAVVSDVIPRRFAAPAMVVAALPAGALAVNFGLLGAITGVLAYGLEAAALGAAAWLALRRAAIRLRLFVLMVGAVLVAQGLSMLVDPAPYRDAAIYAGLGDHLWLTGLAFIAGGVALLGAEARTAFVRTAARWPMLVAAWIAAADLAALVVTFTITGTWTGVLLYASLGMVLLLTAPGAAFAQESPALFSALAASGAALDLAASASLQLGGPEILPGWATARPGAALGALCVAVGFAVATRRRGSLRRFVVTLGVVALVVGAVSALVAFASARPSTLALIGAVPDNDMANGLPSGPIAVVTAAVALLVYLRWPHARFTPFVLIAWATAVLVFVALNLLAFAHRADFLLTLYGPFASREHAALLFGTLATGVLIVGISQVLGAPIGDRLFAAIVAIAIVAVARNFVLNATLVALSRAPAPATDPAVFDAAFDADALTVLILVGGGVGASLLFIRTVTFPLRDLLEAIGRARAGEPRAHADIESEDEIGTVARSFNQLTREVADHSELNAAIRRAQEELGEAMLVLEAGEPRSWNAALATISGYDDGELAAMGSILDLWPDAQRADIQALLRSRAHETYRLETVVRRRNGEIADVELAVHPLPTGHDQQLAIMRDITSAQQARRALERLALHDTLTDLPNRALFTDRLERVIAEADRSGDDFGLLYLDLDRFKEVNDAFGHERGDALLREVAARVAGCLSAADTLARFGGDEFAILLPHAHDAATAARVAELVQAALREPFDVHGHDVFIEASAGLVVFPQDGRDAESLLRHAEFAMYAAKRPGKGLSAYVVEHDPQSARRIELMSDLRHAIERNELSLHFQPQLRLDGERAAESLEALVRWRHPARPVTPAEFVPLAENSGFVNELTLWVLHRVVAAAAELRAEGLPHRVALNISARNLHYPGLVDAVARELRDANMDPGRLTIELTETAVMTDAQHALSTLTRLRALGVRLSIDDFGTGTTSLALLERLPVHELKIDRAFVTDMVENRSNDAIVSSVIALGHSLHLAVVAEGVEDARTLEALATKGCDLAQGYHIARPMPLGEAIAWLGRPIPPTTRDTPPAGAAHARR